MLCMNFVFECFLWVNVFLLVYDRKSLVLIYESFYILFNFLFEVVVCGWDGMGWDMDYLCGGCFFEFIFLFYNIVLVLWLLDLGGFFSCYVMFYFGFLFIFFLIVLFLILFGFYLIYYWEIELL